MTYAILYLHGFTSSPLSGKAVATKCHFGRKGVRVYAPDLTWPPKVTDQLLDRFAAMIEGPWAVFGSSLGGFYAARLAHRHNVPAVLLNPCTNPWDAIPAFVGVHDIYGWPHRKIEVTPDFREDFLELACETPLTLAAEKRLLVLSDQDEVLDRNEALRLYGDENLIVSHDDCHQLQHYETHLPAIERFLQDVFPGVG